MFFKTIKKIIFNFGILILQTISNFLFKIGLNVENESFFRLLNLMYTQKHKITHFVKSIHPSLSSECKMEFDLLFSLLCFNNNNKKKVLFFQLKY